jgi:N-acetylneuraminic acid mutarotase
MGGRWISFDPLSVSGQLYAFDPASQTWTTLKPMFVAREDLAATTAGGLLYALGGRGVATLNGSVIEPGPVLASMERYDPATDTWTMRAPMPAPRRAFVAGSVNGIVYAAGGIDAGGMTVATLDAYDPATDMWIPKAPMSTPRSFAAAGVIDGILYVTGGVNGSSPVSSMEAYDPVTNTWTTKAPMPAYVGSTAAVVDGVLYVMTSSSAVYAYDPVADAWSAKSPLLPALGGSSRWVFAAASLNGIVYAVGGSHSYPACCNRSVATVDTFVDSLRWSVGTPAVAQIDQNGSVTARAPGTTTVIASSGSVSCGGTCGTYKVYGPSSLELNGPLNGSVLTAPFTVIGWALNPTVPVGTGVNAVHVWAFPAGGGSGIFVGEATYGLSRPDVGAVFGSQFTNSGFSLTAGASLVPGPYMLAVYGRSVLTGTFDVVRTVNVTVAPPVSNPFIDLNSPREGDVTTSSFEVSGWALDVGAPSGTGVDAVHFYVFPNDGAAPGVFIGQGSYGGSRPDVGAIFGARFNDTGFHYTISGLGPGAFMLGVYARSTVTGTFSIVKTIHFTVNATALLAFNPPAAEAVITSPSFIVGGWSIDRAVESTSQSGPGVETLHVYIYPNPGSGQPPIFLGAAGYGYSRPDVAALYGSRYDASGFYMTVVPADFGLGPGVYDIAVHSYSTVSGFNAVAVVRVTLQ